jgi:hypothetical protein
MRIFDPPRTSSTRGRRDPALRAAAEGRASLLVFPHTFDNPVQAVPVGAGWRVSFDALACRRDGCTQAVSVVELDVLMVAYKARFGGD